MANLEYITLNELRRFFINFIFKIFISIASRNASWEQKNCCGCKFHSWRINLNVKLLSMQRGEWQSSKERQSGLSHDLYQEFYLLNDHILKSTSDNYKAKLCNNLLMLIHHLIQNNSKIFRLQILKLYKTAFNLLRAPHLQWDQSF